MSTIRKHGEKWQSLVRITVFKLLLQVFLEIFLLFFKLWTRSCPNKNKHYPYISLDMRTYLYIFLILVWGFLAVGSYSLLYDIPLFTL